MSANPSGRVQANEDDMDLGNSEEVKNTMKSDINKNPKGSSGDEDSEESEDDDVDVEDGEVDSEEESGDESGSSGDEGEENEEWETENDEDDKDSLLVAQSESDDDDVETCRICLNKFRDQDVGSPEACDHTFCLECIQEWSKRVNTCPVDRQVFRLILAKHAWDDKVFKQIEVQDTDPNGDEEEDLTFCEVCGRSDREDRLLLCDQCDAGYHIECLTPPLHEVPVDEWFCPECVQNEGPMVETVDESQVNQEPTMRENAHSSRSSHLQRRIARTQTSERVRLQLEELRTERARRARHPIESSSEEGEVLSAVSEEAYTSSTATSSTISPKKTTKCPSKPRKKRKKKSSTKRRGVRKKTSTKKKNKRKRKTKKRKGSRKRSVKKRGVTMNRVKTMTQKEQPVTTVKSRLAGRMGLSLPPTGQSIPLQKLPFEKALDAKRAEIGITQLSVLGNRNELVPLEEITNPTASGFASRPRHPCLKSQRSRSPRKYSESALLSHRPVGKPNLSKSFRPFAPSTAVNNLAPAAAATATPLDILGSIMADQNKLNLNSQDVTINRDGSLIARKPMADASFSLKKLETATPKQTLADKLNEDLSGNILVDYGLAEDSANDSDRELKSSERDKLNKTERIDNNPSLSKNVLSDNSETLDRPCDGELASNQINPIDSLQQNPPEDPALYDPFEDISDGGESTIGDIDNSSLISENVMSEQNTSNICDKNSDENCTISESDGDSGSDDNVSVNSEKIVTVVSESPEQDELTKQHNKAEDSQRGIIKSNSNEIKAASSNSDGNKDVGNSERAENESVKSASSIGDSGESISGNSDIEQISNKESDNSNESVQDEIELTKDDFENGPEIEDDKSITSPASCNISVGSNESGEIKDEPGEISDEPVHTEETRQFEHDRVKFRAGFKRTHSSATKSEKNNKDTEPHHLQTISDSPKKFKSFSFKRERDFKKTKDPNAASAFDKPIEKDEGLYSCLLAEAKITRAEIAGMNSPGMNSPNRPIKKKVSLSKTLRSKSESDKDKSSIDEFKPVSESKTELYNTDMLTEKKFETEESEEEEEDSRGTKILSVFSVLQRLGTSDTQENQSDGKWGRNERNAEDWIERKDRKHSHKEHRRSERKERSHSKEKTRRSVEMFDNDGLKDVRVIVISDDERENEQKSLIDNRRSERNDRKYKSHSQDKRERHRDRDRERERDRDHRERDRDREKDRERVWYHKSKERPRHSRSRSRSHERHRHRRRERSRSRSRERSLERSHKKKKRERDRSKERDHDRYSEREHRRRSWSHSPHRKKEREKDEFGRDKHRHEQSDERVHKHRRYDGDKSEYSDTKKTRIIEAEVTVKKHEEKTNEPYNVIQTSLGSDENSQSDIDDEKSNLGRVDTPTDLLTIPPQEVASCRGPSVPLIVEESKYDPAFPTDSASPQPLIQPRMPPELQMEYMGSTFEANNQFQQPVVSLGNSDSLPTGPLESMPTGPSGILRDGPILIPPPNMPPPNQPPGLPMHMGFGMLPPGYQPSMQPGMPPQRQILVNSVLVNRPPPIGQIQNTFPQLRWEVPPQGMIPVHNRFPGAVPRGPMVMNGGFEGMPPPPDNLQTFPPMIQGPPDPQTHPIHFQEQLLPSSVSMSINPMRPESVPIPSQNSLPGTMIPIPQLNYSQPRPSLLGPGPVPISQPPPQLPISNEISQPTSELNPMVPMTSLLNSQAHLTMMSKALPALNENKDTTPPEDVFKVPLPPTPSNKLSKEVVDSSEVVDMDVDMDMSSPGEVQGAIELSSEFKDNRKTSKSAPHEQDVSSSRIQGLTVESSKKEKSSRDPRNSGSSKSSKSSRRSSEHKSRRSSKSGKENSSAEKECKEDDAFKAPFPIARPSDVKTVQPAVKQLEEISRLLSQQFQLALIAKKQNAENAKRTPSTPPDEPEDESVETMLKTPPSSVKKIKHGRRTPVKMNDEELHAAIRDLTAQEEVPSSAVELTNNEKYIKKLHLQERVVEEVKLALKPFYSAKKVTKEQYKDILRRAVPKICHSKSGDINPVKIRSLVDAYVDKYRKGRKKPNDSLDLQLDESADT